MSRSLFPGHLLLVTGTALFASLAAVQSSNELDWKAWWVWGSQHQDLGPGFFRLTFQVEGPVVAAGLQGSGDDGYQLYLNGEPLRSGGFGFGRTDVDDLTGRLRPGKNVLAARCENYGFPGGWLAQLQITYADGREVFVVTNRETRFHAEEQPGWNAVTFDDSAWEPCQELAQPPGGVWGPLPLQYMGRRREVELVELQAPERVVAGEAMTVQATLRPLTADTRDEQVSVRVMRDGVALGSIALAPHPPTSTWTAGQAVTLPPLQVPVSRYAPSGPAVLELSLTRCRFPGVGLVVQRPLQIQGREGRVRATPARVALHLGAPTLFVNGRPRPTMVYLQGHRPVPAEYRRMAEAGYQIFSLGLELGWVGPRQYDYAATDATMMAALQGAPDGYFVPRVAVTAPGWWCKLHPEELVGCADGAGLVMDGWGGTEHESFASQRWRREAGEALAQLIRHIRRSPYADRVIGYHVASGIYGEWHLWSPEHLPDVSEPMRQEFIRWCRERYGHDLGRLRQAWGEAAPPYFEQITCPTQEERFASDLGAFKDLAKSRRVSDYWACLHQTTVSAIEHFCRVVKTATRGQALAGAFYAYLEDLGWPQEGGHLAAHQAYLSPSIDFFASPHSYSHRALGQSGSFRAHPASLRLHGKLFIDEADDRTHLSGDRPYMYTENVEQDVAIMRREALNVLTHRVGLWWFDMTTGWYNHPALLQAARDLHRLAERVQARPAENYSEVAVVVDPTTYYAMADWKAGLDPLSYRLTNQQFEEFQRIGAPYDVLLLDDALAPGARDYRCYVFVNTWHMGAARRQELAHSLQRDGRSLVFIYAPGYSSEAGLDVAQMTELTGMTFGTDPDGGSLTANWSDGAGRVRGLQPGKAWGTAEKMAPRFSVTSAEVTALAEWAEGGGIAAALQRHPGWTSLYCGTGPVPAELLAHVMGLAGVHSWTTAGSRAPNFWAGNGLLGVHTTRSGRCRFRLPWNATARDALTGEVIASHCRVFSVDLPRWTTGIYQLERGER